MLKNQPIPSLARNLELSPKQNSTSGLGQDLGVLETGSFCRGFSDLLDLSDDHFIFPKNTAQRTAMLYMPLKGEK